MGNSALGRGTAIEENKVKASSGDGSPDFLDGKVDGTTIQVVGNQLVGTPSGYSESATISFSRNMSTATGSVGYTGIGFQPTRMIVYATVSSGTGFEVSWGESVDTSGTERTMGMWHDGNTTGYNVDQDTNGILIYIRFGANTYWGELGSYDADGFTIDWFRSNSPTGTIVARAMCFA